MASIRRHARSPFCYLRKRDDDTGKWGEESTGLRWDDAKARRRAQRLADAATARERRDGEGRAEGAFSAWVPGYLQSHFSQRRPGTHKRAKTAWTAIKAFLDARRLIYPRQIKYGHAADFMQWRMENKVHERKAGHNTARLELKFLAQLISEAIRLEHCEANPLARCGVGLAPQKAKPELTDGDVAKLRKALAQRAPWMRTCFEISLYTGCRFGECAFPLSHVDFEDGTIQMRDSKRKDDDPRKFFTVPLHPKLRPLLEALRDAGATVTCELSEDKNGRINRAFRDAGVEASFHSLRVTFVTRCHRGGLSEHEAMRLVNHSSKLVHRIYSRLRIDDVRSAQTKIPLP